MSVSPSFLNGHLPCPERYVHMFVMPGQKPKRVFALRFPGIHVFLSYLDAQNVDGRDVGERKRRRPSDAMPGHDEGKPGMTKKGFSVRFALLRISCQ